MVESSKEAVVKWEQGERAPRGDSLAALSVALGRPMDDFYADPPPPRERAVELPPVFALKTLEKVDPDLRKKAEDFLRSLDREHYAKLRALKKPRK